LAICTLKLDAVSALFEIMGEKSLSKFDR
jgi:hypothetical protein